MYGPRNELFPSVKNVPLQANGSVDILEVVKSTVCTFNWKTIALGSIRSYNTSGNFWPDCNGLKSLDFNRLSFIIDLI